MNLAPFVYHAVNFLSDHMVYWFIAVCFILQIRYLCHPDTKRVVAMGAFRASKETSPAGFYLLWGMNIILTFLAAFIIFGYVTFVVFA
ncbi:MAG: hypothetical protein ACO1QR_17535 [Chthoniobacteraceae bacterium]